MRGFFRKKWFKILTSFWAALGFLTGVKWCKSEEVKDKLTPTLIHLGSVKGVK